MPNAGSTEIQEDGGWLSVYYIACSYLKWCEQTELYNLLKEDLLFWNRVFINLAKISLNSELSLIYWLGVFYIPQSKENHLCQKALLAFIHSPQTHTLTRTRSLSISTYSQTRGDWHYWHRMVHSPVQLLFQSSRCSVLGSRLGLPLTPLPLSLSLSLTHQLPLSPPPLSSRWALPEDDFTLWKRAAVERTNVMLR